MTDSTNDVTQAHRDYVADIVDACGYIRDAQAIREGKGWLDEVQALARLTHAGSSQPADQAVERARQWSSGVDIPAVEQRHKDAAAWAMDRTPDSLTWDKATASHVTPERRWQMKRVAEAMARIERQALATIQPAQASECVCGVGDQSDIGHYHENWCPAAAAPRTGDDA